MVAERALYHTGSLFTAPRPQIEATQSSDEEHLKKLFHVLEQRFQSRVVMIAEITEEGRTLWPVAIWPSPGRAISTTHSIPGDKGTEALARGEIDAVIYADARRAPSAVAKVIAAAGCSSAVIVPITTETKPQFLVAVGFKCDPNDLADRVSGLLSVLAPKIPATTKGQ